MAGNTLYRLPPLSAKEEKEEVEEEVGKAVEPADSYKTQWGRVKDREGKRP